MTRKTGASCNRQAEPEKYGALMERSQVCPAVKDDLGRVHRLTRQHVPLLVPGLAREHSPVCHPENSNFYKSGLSASCCIHYPRLTCRCFHNPLRLDPSGSSSFRSASFRNRWAPAVQRTDRDDLSGSLSRRPPKPGHLPSYLPFLAQMPGSRVW